MKTTLDLPEDLLRHTKATSALLGQHMKDYVAHALREQLRRDAPSTMEKPWMKFYGAFKRIMPADELAAMHRAIEEEGERVDESHPEGIP